MSQQQEVTVQQFQQMAMVEVLTKQRDAANSTIAEMSVQISVLTKILEQKEQEVANLKEQLEAAQTFAAA
jgi:predicted RNase H-like nuclease (RuvC/YqgF family)